MPVTLLGAFDALLPKDSSSRRIARDIVFDQSTGLKLDLYAPRRPRGKLPLLVFVHGGGWDSGDRREYSFVGRALAALGFLVACADYRVFPDAVFPAFVDDLGAAATWLTAHAAEYGGDPARLILAGHSAGAYNSVMLALQPARFGFSGRIEAVVGLSGPYDFYPYDVKQSIDAFGTYPEPLTTQPVNLVTAAAPPMFLGHGVRDTTVGDYHTVRLSAKLRVAGVPVVERHYPNLAHPQPIVALSLPLRRVWPVYGDVAGFLGPLAIARM